MNKLTFLSAVFSGLFFAAWPLLMNRSGLPGINAAFVFITVNFLIIVPLAAKNFNAAMFNYWAIGAGTVSCVALLVFTNSLAKIPKEVVSNFFVVMLVSQVCVAALYQAALTGITFRKAVGFILAAIVAFLLK